MKESNKEYLELDRKKWNMKVIVIPVIIDALGTNPKDIEKRLKEIQRKNRNYKVHSIIEIG